MTDTPSEATANYRHLKLVSAALGLKLAFDLRDRDAAHQEAASLRDALDQAETLIHTLPARDPDPEPDPEDGGT